MPTGPFFRLYSYWLVFSYQYFHTDWTFLKGYIPTGWFFSYRYFHTDWTQASESLNPALQVYLCGVIVVQLMQVLAYPYWPLFCTGVSALTG
jgi:hypothetical protein